MSHVILSYDVETVRSCIAYDEQAGTFKKTASFGAGDVQVWGPLTPSGDGRFRVGNPVSDQRKIHGGVLAIFLKTGRVLSGRSICYKNGNRRDFSWDNLKGTLDKSPKTKPTPPPPRTQVIQFTGTLIIEGDKITLEGYKT